MALRKIRLGTIIKKHDIRNSDNRIKNVMGISVKKCFREPTSKVNKDELKNYKIVKPGWFSSVQTTHNEKCFAFAYNDTDKEIVVSSVNLVFSVDEKIINPRWLQMFFNRFEFDRYARNNSWGSAREVFSWDDLCNVCLEIPDLSIQKEFVKIYLSMVENQKVYESGLEDLKLVCDGYIEDLRRNMPSEEIGKFIHEIKVKNLNRKIEVNKAVSTEKIFINSHADLEGVDISNYLICRNGQFAYNTVTTKNGNKISIACNKDSDCLVSPIYTVFEVDERVIDVGYLMTWFKRGEFDRYARFHSWGSAREMFTFEDMKHVKIPIPDILVQQAISNIYKCYIERKEINERLKQQIKNICPILIKGSIEEGR